MSSQGGIDQPLRIIRHVDRRQYGRNNVGVIPERKTREVFTLVSESPDPLSAIGPTYQRTQQVARLVAYQQWHLQSSTIDHDAGIIHEYGFYIQHEAYLWGDHVEGITIDNQYEYEVGGI